ncbi:MAG: hypothetical protein MZV70_69830, partial [Desulfobacterales bacterium]|nr:hypothetical protein [Desulfobacterales bacterium]
VNKHYTATETTNGIDSTCLKLDAEIGNILIIQPLFPMVLETAWSVPQVNSRDVATAFWATLKPLDV